jgi:hypothetical protein
LFVLDVSVVDSVDVLTVVSDEVEIVVEESKDDSDEDSGNDTIIEDDGIGNEIIEEENKDKIIRNISRITHLDKDKIY